ncbi:MAG: molybdenum cofactor guanylyltransferase [Bdellovibrio sp.]|nr:molybdenum cofactor guanylyltransferase [Methylotenera sp.]
MPISAIILAGGRAMRMGGANKGLMLLFNTPLITYVIYKVSRMADDVLISANRDIARFETFGYPVLADKVFDANGDLIGPLAGLQAGLTAAKYDYVLCVPCDMPNLPQHLANLLMQCLLDTNAEIVVVKANNDVIPVVCLCKKTVLPSLTTYITQGGRKVSTWQKSCAYAELDLTDTFIVNKKGEVLERGGDFANLNSLQDIKDYE